MVEIDVNLCQLIKKLKINKKRLIKANKKIILRKYDTISNIALTGRLTCLRHKLNS